MKAIVGPVHKLDGSLCSNDQETVDVLNEFFESTFTEEDITTIPDHTLVVFENLSNIEITEDEVYDKLIHLDVRKAPGPNDIHPKVLKSCAISLTKPLHQLFSYSLDIGEIPSEWKTCSCYS